MKVGLRLRFVFLAALVMAAVIAAARAEPNAFLNHKAVTVSQLVDQLKSDREVADRYVRHFGKSRQDLVEYFSGLHLAKLNEEGTYMVYLVDDQGVIKARPQRLKAGTLVFADSSGMPVLKATCGNALVPGTAMQTTALTPTVPTISESLRDVAITTPESEARAEEHYVAMAPPQPVELQPIMPGQISTGQKSQGFAVPALLAAIGGAGGILIGTGGNAPVPEPATLLVMASALAALRLRRRK